MRILAIHVVLLGLACPFVSASAQCVEYADHPVWKTTVELSGIMLNDLVVDGGIAYCTTNAQGIEIVDITDPDQPVLLSFTPLVQAERVAVAGDLAFVTAGRLYVYDVADLSNPRPLGNADTDGLPYGVAVQGSLVFVAVSGDGLQIFDVSDPTNPQALATLDVGATAYSVDVLGDYVYLGTNDGLFVVDTSDPSLPAVVGFVASSYLWRIQLVGDRVYGAGLDFLVFDVADPAHPAVLSSLSLPDGSRGVAAHGDKVYVTGSEDGLREIDITDPLAPVVTHRWPWYGCDPVALHDGHVWVGTGDLMATDVSPDTGPVEPVATLDFAEGPTTCVERVGDRLYVAAGGFFRVLDLSVPAAPTTVGLVDLGMDATDIEIHDGCAYAAVGTNGMRVVGIADETQPTLGDLEDSYFEWIDTVILGDVGYGTDLDGVRLLRIFNPPTQIWSTGRVDTPGQPRGMDAADGHLYVADGIEQLRIYDLADPANPAFVTDVADGFNCRDVVVSGGLAYLAVYGGLVVVDVIDPSLPVEVSFTPHGLGTENSRVLVTADHAFVAVDNWGIAVYELADPSQPVFAGSIPTMGPIADVAVGPDHVYVCDGASALGIYPIPCAATAASDCNGNGIEDAVEIAAHPSLDFNNDGILDSCQQGQGISGVPGAEPVTVLHDARPNPFNPHTVIAFDLARAGRASLRIYDISGRLVRNLLHDGPAEQGRNSFTWDGRDDMGRSVASGVYFSRLDTKDAHLTGRLVLIK